MNIKNEPTPAAPISEQGPSPFTASLTIGTSDTRLAIAEMIFRTNRIREQLTGDLLFSDPAWDLLLHLFIARQKDEEVGFSRACEILPPSPNTLRRYVSALEKRGFVEVSAFALMDGDQPIRLTDAGAIMMNQILTGARGEQDPQHEASPALPDYC